MCDYQGYEFGAGTYPDSVCVDGRLYDADNCDNDGNLYEPMEDIPCPMCKPTDAILYWTERNSLCGNSGEEASEAAHSLVADIRRNRGVTDMPANVERNRPSDSEGPVDGSVGGCEP